MELQKRLWIRNTTARLQETQGGAKYSRLDNVHYTQAHRLFGLLFIKPDVSDVRLAGVDESQMLRGQKLHAQITGANSYRLPHSLAVGAEQAGSANLTPCHRTSPARTHELQKMSRASGQDIVRSYRFSHVPHSKRSFQWAFVLSSGNLVCFV